MLYIYWLNGGDTRLLYKTLYITFALTHIRCGLIVIFIFENEKLSQIVENYHKIQLFLSEIKYFIEIDRLFKMICTCMSPSHPAIQVCGLKYVHKLVLNYCFKKSY